MFKKWLPVHQYRHVVSLGRAVVQYPEIEAVIATTEALSHFRGDVRSMALGLELAIAGFLNLNNTPLGILARSQRPNRYSDSKERKGGRYCRGRALGRRATQIPGSWFEARLYAGGSPAGPGSNTDRVSPHLRARRVTFVSRDAGTRRNQIARRIHDGRRIKQIAADGTGWYTPQRLRFPLALPCFHRLTANDRPRQTTRVALEE